MKRIVCVLLVFISAAVLVSAKDQPLLAVTTISANGVSEADAKACRSIVETALFKTELFTVLSYSDMQEILEAQAFSLSGCTDDSCAIEVGKLLAAENIVLGELSVIGNTYNLAIRLIDVGSSRTMGAETITFGSLDEMQEQVFIASYKLAGLDYNPDTGVAFEVAGEIYVTAPDNLVLEVYLDGQLQGVTPVLLENVSFGNHLVEVKSDEYQYSKEVTILSKDIVEVEADITLLTGNVILSITPKDAEGYTIKIGDMICESGLIRDVPAGKQILLIEGSGWFFRGEIEVEADSTNRVATELEAGGYVELFAMEDASATAEDSAGVTVDLNLNAQTTLKPGKYNIKITHADYEDTLAVVDIERDKMVKVEQELVHTEDFYRRERIAELENRLVEVEGKTRFWKSCTWIFGGLTVSAGGLAGTGEALVQSEAVSLESLGTQYDASTDAASVSNLGSQITDVEDSIRMWRDIRDISIYTAVPAAAMTGLSWILASRQGSIERQIARLEGELNED